MEQKQRFFIYERKEMGVLLLLGALVAVFAFTLGVHLGKRVAVQSVGHAPGDADTVPTVPDKIPNRQELTEQSKGAQQAADESLNQALHDEVARTGIRLDTARQVQLPKQTVSQGGGVTTQNHGAAPDSHHDQRGAPAAHEAAKPTEHGAAPTAPPAGERDSVALHRKAPEGKFTLQIGSFPVFEEANDQSNSLEALGLRPYMRQATVKGRTWYRLYVGGFPTQAAAEKAGARYVVQHMIEAYIVAKKVDGPGALE